MSDILMYILVAVIILMMILLSYVFYKLIVHERELEKENFLLSKGYAINNESFKRFIDRKIKVNKGKNFFTVIGVTITNYNQILDSYGKADVVNVYNEIQEFVKEITGRLSVIGNSDDLGTFYIYIPKVYTEREMNVLSKDIIKQMGVKFKIFGDIYVDVLKVLSYITYPLGGNDANTLLTNLKLALYLVDRSNKDFLPYSKDMDKDKRFIDFYYEVKNAINNKEFSLYYQPILNVMDDKIEAFETFIRWNHPVKGVLPPKEFIDILEDSGDINWVGLWSLEEIFKTHLTVFNKYHKTFKYHVNFSHVQFLNDSLIDDLTMLLEKYRINPDTIVIEIVDFPKMVNHEKALRMLLRLINNNINVAVNVNDIDYQLISDIEKHRINIIKINNRILNLPGSTKDNFVNLIKDISKRNDVLVIVESVETKENKMLTIEEGFKYNQGFLYSKPLNLKETYNYIEKTLINNVIVDKNN